MFPFSPFPIKFYLLARLYPRRVLKNIIPRFSGVSLALPIMDLSPIAFFRNYRGSIAFVIRSVFKVFTGPSILRLSWQHTLLVFILTLVMALRKHILNNVYHAFMLWTTGSLNLLNLNFIGSSLLSKLDFIKFIKFVSSFYYLSVGEKLFFTKLLRKVFVNNFLSLNLDSS